MYILDFFDNVFEGSCWFCETEINTEVNEFDRFIIKEKKNIILRSSLNKRNIIMKFSNEEPTE